MSTVIIVEILGKKYTLHHQQREQYTALRDVIADTAATIGKKIIAPFTRRSSSLITPHSSLLTEFGGLMGSQGCLFRGQAG
jgi:hypothetical protein